METRGDHTPRRTTEGASPPAMSSQWSDPPPVLRLSENEVHVWRAFLDREADRLDDLGTALAEDERRRAARFVFARDRSHFARTRAVLRDILSRYLGRTPASIEFAYAHAGKPCVQLLDSDPRLRFNVSHSRGLAVYGFSSGRAIGIDAESIQTG